MKRDRAVCLKLLYIFLFCTTVVFVKNEYTRLLLNNATYGMPALIKNKQVENLYIGSSMFRQGLDINLLEKAEKSTYILAYNGNQPVLEYYELANLIENDVTIDKLYIDMYVYSAWREPSIEDEKIFLETDLKTKCLLYKAVYHKVQLEKIWRMFVSSNNELLLFWPVNNLIINNQFHNGGTLTQTQFTKKKDLENMGVPKIQGNMNQFQKDALSKMIALAKQNNIEITFIETPKYHTVSMDKCYIEAMKEYVEFLKKQNISCILSSTIAENFNCDTMNDIYTYEYDVFNNQYYLDNIHLSSKGREEFSKKLFNCIKSLY